MSTSSGELDGGYIRAGRVDDRTPVVVLNDAPSTNSAKSFFRRMHQELPDWKTRRLRLRGRQGQGVR